MVHEELCRRNVDILIIYTSLSDKEKKELLEIEDEVLEKEGYLDEMNIIKKSLVQWK